LPAIDEVVNFRESTVSVLSGVPLSGAHELRILCRIAGRVFFSPLQRQWQQQGPAISTSTWCP